MKKLTFFCLVALMTIGITSFKTQENSPGNESRVEVIFDRHLDFNDIVKIKLDLSQKGVIINYKQLAFDAEGKLNAIDFFVDFKDGFSGSASGTGEQLGNQRPFGFVRDYSENAEIPFGTGYLK